MTVNQVEDSVAIVSGSSMGIGKAIATELGRKGAKVVLNGRDVEKLRRTESELLALGLDVSSCAADIRYPAQCEKLVKAAIDRYGKLDIVVNNAGLTSRGSIENMAMSNIEDVIATNYCGPAYLTKQAIPYLRKTQGHIIYVNSVGGFRGFPYNAAYTASKMAQAALADAVRIELFDDGIHVGLVHVGFTKNDPRKTILDVDGSRVFMPKRTNVHLASPESVAKSICQMIESRTSKITLSRLGHLTEFLTRYLPRLSNWYLQTMRAKVKTDYTLLGGRKVAQELPSGAPV